MRFNPFKSARYFKLDLDHSLTQIAFGLFLGFIVIIGMRNFSMEQVTGLTFYILIAIIFLLRIDLVMSIFLYFRSVIDITNDFTITSIGGLQGVNVASLITTVFAIAGFAFILIKRINVFYPILNWYFLLLISVLISMINWPYLTLSMVDFLKYLTLFIVALLTIYLTDKEDDIRRNMKIIVISSILPILLAVYELITGQGMQSSKTFQTFSYSINRASSTLGPFGLGAYLTIIGPVAYFLSLDTKGFRSKIYLSITILAYLVAYFTYAKAVWMIIGFQLMLLLWINKKSRILITLIIITLTVISFDKNFLMRFQEDTEFYSTNRPELIFSGRIYLYQLIFEELGKQPVYNLIFGSGPRSVQIMVSTPRIGIPWQAHSDILRFLFEQGILGMSVFILFYYSLLRNVYNYQKRNPDSFLGKYTKTFLFVIVGYIPIFAGNNTISGLGFMWYYFAMLGMFLAIPKFNQPKMLNNSK